MSVPEHFIEIFSEKRLVRPWYPWTNELQFQSILYTKVHFNIFLVLHSFSMTSFPEAYLLVQRDLCHIYKHFSVKIPSVLFRYKFSLYAFLVR